MRSRHKLLALALSLALLLSLAVPVCAAETTTSTTKDLTGHIVILHTNDVQMPATIFRATQPSAPPRARRPSN